VAGWHHQDVLSRDTYLEALRRDASAFGDLLHDADLMLPVPDCPGWTVADLASHLGGVHRWAHGVVTTGASGEEPVGPRDRVELTSWFAEGAHQLITALATADPDSPTWTFGPPPRLVSFWVRRQPHETSMHLRDLHGALRLPTPGDVGLAADGVDEVVTMMFPRQVRLGRIPALPHGIQLSLIDAPEITYTLVGDGTDPHAATVATVSGTAQDVLLALWRRLPVDALTIDGDAAAARAVFALALTP
jgi:uncharacterized protein (TIGR03083 family)